MAAALHISVRQLDRLAGDGVLPQRSDGLFSVREVIDAHATHLAGKLHKPSKLDRVHVAQTQLIQRRLDREQANLIPMPDSLAVFDAVTAGFLDSVAEVGREAGKGQHELEQKRIGAITDQVAARLAETFAVERAALVTGKLEANE